MVARREHAALLRRPVAAREIEKAGLSFNGCDRRESEQRFLFIIRTVKAQNSKRG